MELLLTQAFIDLGIHPEFSNALTKANYNVATDIQKMSIPVALTGSDIVALAQTGTGKTAAFGLPLLQRLLALHGAPQRGTTRSLVIAPTRELAVQIHRELTRFAAGTRLSLACIYGGVGQGPQVRAISRGIDVLIATPGRLLDLVQQNHLTLNSTTICVLDEADRLLDMGFIRDIKRIVALLPRDRQTLMFSATMPHAVTELADALLRDPKRIAVAPREVTVKKIEQRIIFVEPDDKTEVLAEFLHTPDVSKAIVFTRTKYGADKLSRKLQQHGIDSAVIHGNKSQNERRRALNQFTSGKAWVLVATDVAARGIDIEDVSHVVNFELPHEPESYVHRIGRTGRAGASGAAVSLVERDARKRLKAIERLIGFSLTGANDRQLEGGRRPPAPGNAQPAPNARPPKKRARRHGARKGPGATQSGNRSARKPAAG